MRRDRMKRHVKMFDKLSRFAREESGVQLVELAIVLPVFLMLFGAAAEFGRYFYEYTTLDKATRAASRYLATAAVNGTEDTRARNIAVYGNMDGTGTPIVKIGRASCRERV